jgi:sugar O-acyltransferase (sialic acid O-acetyltransferase NeuD family)
MRRNLYIIGAGGLAREMAMLAEQINAQQHKWNLRGFVSEDEHSIGKDLGIAPIIGNDEWLLSQNDEADLLIGIGTPSVREKAIRSYLQNEGQYQFPNFIHPSAHLDFRRISLGVGNAITSGCSFTCDIKIGNFNLFNLNTTLGHDAIVGNYNVINPGVNISGGVTLGDRILLGTGSQVLENVTLGSNVIVGAGAVVISDLPSDVTVVGIPAKPIST